MNLNGLMDKIKFDWKQYDWKHAILHVLVIFIVMGGILLITRSFFMSLGIMLLLFVVDHYLQEIDEKLKERAERKNKESE